MIKKIFGKIKYYINFVNEGSISIIGRSDPIQIE
jgi:hypothetical protein